MSSLTQPTPELALGVSPQELIEVLDRALPQVVAELIEDLREEWPDYAGFLDTNRDDALSNGQCALQRLVATVDGTLQAPGGGDARDAVLASFEELGRAECREDRQLSSLLAAYRLGGRTAWSHLAHHALSTGMSSSGLAAVAAAMFDVIDELSSASEQGYLDEQRSTTAARERHRVELAEMLFAGRTSDSRLRRVAAAAGWPLPRTACLVLTDGEDRALDLLSIRLGSVALPVRHSRATGVVVADPRLTTRRDELARLLAGTRAVVGLEVDLSTLPASLDRVQHAVSLRHRGLLDGDPLFVDEHLPTLLMHRDEDLLATLAVRALRPLDTLTAAARRRLRHTLQVWLATMGDAQQTARQLGVHPHTVHYRLGQLRELFGDRLDDPAGRLELTIALNSASGVERGRGRRG